MTPKKLRQRGCARTRMRERERDSERGAVILLEFMSLLNVLGHCQSEGFMNGLLQPLGA